MTSSARNVRGTVRSPNQLDKSRAARARIMDDIVKDFLIESNENLDRLDQELVKLESDPTSRPLLDNIFRTIHTIKGSCGFLGFSQSDHFDRTADQAPGPECHH